MSLDDFGEVLRPRHCRVSASPDRSRIALTFRSEGRSAVTIVLPLDGAAGLQRQLAQGLFLLGAKPPTGQAKPAAPAEAPAAT